MDKVVSPDPEPVPVTTGHNHMEIVICQFGARRNGQGSAVKGVHAVGSDEAWKV
jgi:hypothetical protein